MAYGHAEALADIAARQDARDDAANAAITCPCGIVWGNCTCDD